MDFALSNLTRRFAGLALAVLTLPGMACDLSNDDEDGVGGTGSDLEPGECIGPETQAEVPGDAACDDCAPAWSLEDFQPRSCGVGETYGLSTFEGQVTVVALLAGWCGFCQAQAQKMEQLRIELGAEGVDVMMVAVNGTTASSAEDQQKLIDQCSFPLFQDTEEVDAWAMHGGSKDDIYIYNGDGSLAVALPYGEGVETNLSTDEGYANLRQAILDAQ